MRLPRGEDAIVPIEKLRDYCLNPDHPLGAAKARVFAAALGIVKEDADALRRILLQSAAQSDTAEVLGSDPYGERYRLDVSIRGVAATHIVRTGWIVRRPGDAPYLTTAFVLSF